MKKSWENKLRQQLIIRQSCVFFRLRLHRLILVRIIRHYEENQQNEISEDNLISCIYFIWLHQRIDDVSCEYSGIVSPTIPSTSVAWQQLFSVVLLLRDDNVCVYVWVRSSVDYMRHQFTFFFSLLVRCYTQRMATIICIWLGACVEDDERCAQPQKLQKNLKNQSDSMAESRASANRNRNPSEIFLIIHNDIIY